MLVQVVSFPHRLLVGSLYDHRRSPQDALPFRPVRRREREVAPVRPRAPEILVELQVDIPESALVADRGQVLTG